MYEILKAISAVNGWVFTYARKDYQNLFDETEQKNLSHIFLDPVEVEDNENDTGIVESRTHAGFFMILFSSDIDELSYDDRYQQHIKPIVEGNLITLKDAIRCGYNVEFNQWKKTEVINAFDYNFDGVLVSYNITIDE